jgi:hypothetical protein
MVEIGTTSFKNVPLEAVYVHENMVNSYCTTVDETNETTVDNYDDIHWYWWDLFSTLKAANPELTSSGFFRGITS